jgi:hypothetical protein
MLKLTSAPGIPAEQLASPWRLPESDQEQFFRTVLEQVEAREHETRARVIAP